MNTLQKKKAPKKPDVRRLTITEQVRFNAYNRPITIPFIRLSGCWLQSLGFMPGEKIVVTTMNKLLIIRTEE